MPLIFVNYRTGDEEATATLVERELSRRFGDENVFRASKSISPGSRYPQELVAAARSCRVLLAVIGPRWTEATGAGQRPSDSAEDWSRREILEAFEYGAIVIPVLVGRTTRLRPEELPPVLAELADCQYRRLDHRNAEADLARLADDLEELVPELAEAAARQGHEGRASLIAEEEDGGGAARVRARVIKHRQRGGIGNLNGDFSGTFVSEPQGPVHTGSGHLYQVGELHLEPRCWGDGADANYDAGMTPWKPGRGEHPQGRSK
ncbi:toll/interleukin-1 receptor domain-containing protein [Streptomyces sp. NPDC047315]|uniref:toll/interleukin-1 receptor domain-containing protein n=1 Tax=Streptomyces sp. NPDC047315 TaxID=3155142 RepID=UPI00340D5D37